MQQTQSTPPTLIAAVPSRWNEARIRRRGVMGRQIFRQQMNICLLSLSLFAAKCRTLQHDYHYPHRMARRSGGLPAAAASGARHRASHHSARMALVVSHGRGGREQPRRVTEHGTTGDGSPRPDRMHRCHHRPYGGGLLETPRKRTGNGHGRQPHGADRSVSSHPNARQPGHRGFLCFWVRGWI